MVGLQGSQELGAGPPGWWAISNSSNVDREPQKSACPWPLPLPGPSQKSRESPVSKEQATPRKEGPQLYKLPLLEGMPVSDLEAPESR